MEITQLVTLLAPIAFAHLDYIRGKVAEGALTEGGKELVKLLKDKLLSKPTAAEAVEDAAKNPADPDAQAALRIQLKKLLESDPEFAATATRLAPAAQIIQTGDNNKAAIVQGNNNQTTIS